jgi:myo-inositol-1(or 4)-monophosphatase
MIDETRLAEIVREAGRIACSLWPGAGHRLHSWEKAPGDPVSDADLAVDRFLKRELNALLPAAAWLSEETLDDPTRLESDCIWVVDPIDGTRDFVRGRPGWAVSVALVRAGRPLIGMLSAPARGEEWRAVAGQGAWRNGERLQASTREQLAGARVPSPGLAKVDRMLHAVAQPNSIALRIAMVAADKADLVATMRWGYEWDIAAATLIAREAGAAIGDAFGRPLNFNKREPGAFGLVVSAPSIFGEAVAHISERAKLALAAAA